MTKKLLAIAFMAVALTAVSPEEAAAQDGYYTYKVVTQREWVPARTERYQERVWVPGRTVTEYKTVIVRQGCYTFDSCGNRIWNPPVTRRVCVRRQLPGCYQLVWRTRTIPGCYRNVNRRVRVWVPCNTRPQTRVVVRGRVTASSAGRDIRRTGRRINRETRRSSKKVGKEVRRAGRRVGKQIRRLFN